MSELYSELGKIHLIPLCDILYLFQPESRLIMKGRGWLVEWSQLLPVGKLPNHSTKIKVYLIESGYFV